MMPMNAEHKSSADGESSYPMAWSDPAPQIRSVLAPQWMLLKSLVRQHRVKIFNQTSLE